MAAVQQLKFTANLSFMFKENDFLSRYKAASENGNNLSFIQALGFRYAPKHCRICGSGVRS